MKNIIIGIKSLFIPIIILCLSVHAQHIIILNGTTTAGKSSVALDLKALLEAQSTAVEIFAIDTFMVPKIQWALVLNRFNPFNVCVANADLLTPTDILEMGKESQVELCMAVKAAYAQGKTVIIDASIYRKDQIDFYQQALANLKVTWALVYCPLATLVERVIKRNQTSKIIEQRSVFQALDQFGRLYKNTNNNPIDVLSQENLYIACDKAQQTHSAMQNTIPDFLRGIQNVICPFGIDRIQKSLLENFELMSNGKVLINSIMQHDCVVNTGLYNSTTCARAIVKSIQESGKNSK